MLSDNLVLYMQKLSNIAEAIRYKLESHDEYLLEEMPEGIRRINSGSSSQDDTWRLISPPDVLTDVINLDFLVLIVNAQEITVEPEVNENVL